MRWGVILWRGALLVVIGCLAVLVVRFVSAPPAPAVAQPPEQQADEAAPPPGVNALAPMGYTSSLGYISSGRKTTVVGGSTEGVRVYELQQYQGKYDVSDVTQEPEGAAEER